MKRLFSAALIFSTLSALLSLPVSTTVSASLPSAQTASATPANLTLSWSSVAGAEQYRVEEKAPNGTWTVLGTGNFLSYEIPTNKADGDYQYRVVGCLVTPYDGLLKCSEVAEYSAPYTITFPYQTADPLAPANVEIAGQPTPVNSGTVSNDQASEQVGIMAGQFRVDESGAATYQIPLTLPEGIAGTAPQLGLNYSSAAGNGALGIGWSVSGQSAISRCRRTQEQDSENLHLTMTNDDRFCLDGQKLVAVSGSYGVNGTEYRTEVDSRARIISYGTLGSGPSYFTVEREDGSISYYGNQDRLGSRSDATLSADGTAVVWNITSITDNLDNTRNSIRFLYTKGQTGFGQNEILLDEVTYSGNTVDFIYSTNTGREDTRSAYVYGALVESKARLESIEISNHDNVEVRSYNLTYGVDTLSKTQRISSIEECGMVGNSCLPATTFSWNNEQSQMSASIPQTTLSSNSVAAVTPIDINGDGYTDLVYLAEAANINRFYAHVLLNDGAGDFGSPVHIFDIQSSAKNSLSTGLYNAYLKETQEVRLHPADIDGDGYVELLFGNNDAGVLNWKYYDFNTQNIQEIESCTSASGCLLSNRQNDVHDLGFSVSSTGSSVLFHDINADGYPDMVYPKGRRISNGDGTFSVQHASEFEVVGARTGPSKSFATSRSFSQSVTAAGRPEYPGLAYKETMLAEDAPETAADNTIGNRNIGITADNDLPGLRQVNSISNGIPPLDFNGDGVADIAVLYVDIYNVISPDGGLTTEIVEKYFWQVNTLTRDFDAATGTYSSYSYKPFFTFGHLESHQRDRRIIGGDINGDGLGDLLVEGNSNTGTTHFSYRTSNGIDFNPQGAVTLDVDVADLANVQVIDVNRDQRADVLYFDTAQKRWEAVYQNAQGVFGQAVSVLSETHYELGKDLVFVADMNGNGHIGYARLEVDTQTFHSREDAVTQKAPNRIRQITNGFGVKTDIDYGLMTDETVYAKGSGADSLHYGNGSPVFDLISPQPVVKSVTSDAPAYVGSTYNADNRLSVEYFYEGMRIQSGGRGSLGFEKLSTYDVQRNITTETTYYQNFPLTGMPRQTTQYLGARAASPATNTLLSTSISTYATLSLNNGKTVFPYLDKSDEVMYAVNDAGSATQFKSRIITDNTYAVANAEGSHANLTRVDVVTKHTNDTSLSSFVSKVTTTNQYNVDYGASNNEWWLGRVTSTSVSHQRAGKPTITRSSEFEYYPVSSAHAGMLMLEKVMTPSGMTASESELTTRHCYDAMGNRTQTLTHNNQYSASSCALADVSETPSSDPLITARKTLRYQSVNFDTAGRYSTQRSNARFVEATVNSRNALGQTTKSTDINGVQTYVWFDNFGRQYASANNLGQKTITRRALASGGTALGSPTLSSISSSAIHFIEKTTQAGAPTQYQYYDVLGRQIGQARQGFDGRYILQVTRYDQYGRTVAQSNPYYSGDTVHFTTTVYDDFDRPQTVNASSGANTAIAYANNGLSTTSTVTFNSITQGNSTQRKTEVMNVLGENVSITDEAGTIAYDYDATGNLVQVTGVDAVEITTAFDALGRKTSMNDPDKGSWTYRYNALGELIQQTDARGTTTRFYRDRLGRTVERAVSGNGISEHTNYGFTENLLTSESFTSGNTLTKSLIYDNYGRQVLLRSTLDNGVTYTSQTTYDQYGRVFQQFDADATNLNGCIHNGSAVGACWGIKNNYNANGYLLSQEEARYSGSTTDKVVYQKVTAMDAFGNVVGSTQNNDIITNTKAFNPQTGLVDTIQASNGTLIQDNDYQFDSIGNLRSRTRNTLDNAATINIDGNALSVQHETFQYDNVNRLTHIDNTEFVRYQANGNIDWKRGVGNYCYNAARPHAVSGLGTQGCSTQSYVYDANGNMTSGRGRNINYGHFDKPTLISNTQGSTAFAYDTARNRYKRITTEDNDEGVSVTTTTYYLGNLELVSDNQGKNEVRRYLPNAIQTQHGTGAISTKYLHKDHLGSIDTITDENGKILDKLYFDAWGKKVSIDPLQWNTTTQLQAASTLINVLDITPRGFTGHEHVDHADIIHMNGRIYDPTLGRFLQADPHIQAPQNSQSYNRYAYVLNNPLSFTDPSGYFFKALKKFVKKFWKVAVAAVAAYYTFGYALGALSTTSTLAVTTAYGTAVSTFTYATVGAYIGAGAAAGFVGGAIVSGSLKGALRGAFTGAILGGVSYANAQAVNSFGEGARQVATAAIGGCASGVGSGGSCGEGARLAAMTQTLRLGMEAASNYEPTIKTAKGDAVVKLEGKGVENSTVSNVGKSIEARAGTEAEHLVGRNLSSLTIEEAQLLIDTNPLNASKIVIKGGSISFPWDTEGSIFFSKAASNVHGVNSMAVFHDVWMAKQEVTNAFYLGVTIAPSAYINYNALGVSQYDYLHRRIRE